MPANTAPIYPLVPALQSVGLSAANTSSQGGGTIGTNIFLLESAGANGSLVRKVRFSATASVASSAMAATVARVFVSSVSSGATSAADTHLLAEVALPATTGASPTVPTPIVEVPLDIALPPGMHLLVSVHAAPAANTLWKAISVGSDY